MLRMWHCVIGSLLASVSVDRSAFIFRVKPFFVIFINAATLVLVLCIMHISVFTNTILTAGFYLNTSCCLPAESVMTI